MKNIDKEIIRKKILFLNKMKQREINYPSKEIPTEEDCPPPTGDWSIDNWDFELEIDDFMIFINELSKRRIFLGPIDIIELPVYINGKQAYDEDGNAFCEEAVCFYWNVNLDNLEIYLSLLLKIFTQKEKVSILTYKPSRGIFGEIEKEIWEYKLYSNGIITYGDKEIDIRLGLKKILEIFIYNPNQLISRNKIKNELEIYSKDTKDTISKYINLINKAIKKVSKKEPIINHKGEGWVLEP